MSRGNRAASHMNVWDYLYGDRTGDINRAEGIQIIKPVWTVSHGRYKDLAWARKVITLYNAGVKHGFMPVYPPHPPPTRSRASVEPTGINQSHGKSDSVLRVSEGKSKRRQQRTVKIRRGGSA